MFIDSGHFVVLAFMFPRPLEYEWVVLLGPLQQTLPGAYRSMTLGIKPACSL